MGVPGSPNVQPFLFGLYSSTGLAGGLRPCSPSDLPLALDNEHSSTLSICTLRRHLGSSPWLLAIAMFQSSRSRSRTPLRAPPSTLIVETSLSDTGITTQRTPCKPILANRSSSMSSLSMFIRSCLGSMISYRLVVSSVMVSTLESRLQHAYKQTADLQTKLVIRRGSTRALNKVLKVQKRLENRLKREVKEKMSLEKKLLIGLSNARVLQKAVAVQKLTQVRNLVRKLHNPSLSCTACLYREAGRVGGPAHTYERGKCRYRSRRVLWGKRLQ